MRALLRLAKQRGWSEASLATNLGVSVRLLQSWLRRDSLPVRHYRRVAGLLGSRTADRDSIPDALRRAGVDSGKEPANLLRDAGYAAVWLVTSGPEHVVMSLHAAEEFAQVVKVGAADGVPVSSVRFGRMGRSLHYQAFSHTTSLPLRLEFEGVVDATGLEFCREFLLTGIPSSAVKGQRLEKKRETLIFNE